MRLSVSMCSYFGKDYIRDQLLSIHRQTVPVDEIVICDDCSEDDTVEIIRKLTKQYDLPVRLFINEWNYGYKKNFEQAICRCTGDIIFLSDQDDTWIPTKVETIVNYFDRNPDKNFVFTNATLINFSGAECYSQTLFDALGMDKKTLHRFDQGYVLETLGINCRVTGATAAFRASLIPYCIPLPMSIVHDEAIALSSAFQGKIGYISQCLIKYRQHSDQTLGIAQALKRRKMHWDNTTNIMMWHRNLAEPYDLRTKNKLDFMYRRYWAIRSSWAIFRLSHLYFLGLYRKYETYPQRTFWWDIKSRFVYLFDRLKVSLGLITNY